MRLLTGVSARLSVLLLVTLFCPGGKAFAAEESVFKVSVAQTMGVTYDAVYKALEEERFYVVFEPDIGANLSRMAKRLGDDYNRSELSALRSMVFCNAWYANRVSNLDPDMLGFCPLHITLYERRHDTGVQTTVLFNRPTSITAGSPAHEVFGKIESEVIAAIRKGLAVAADKAAGAEGGSVKTAP